MCVCVQGFGHAVGAILMDLKKATTVASITVMTFMLAGGFFVAVSIFMYRNHTFLLTCQFLHIYIYIPYLAESSRFHSMAKVSLLQLSHLQTSTKSAVWTHDTFSQWNRNRQWCKRSICTCSHDLWLQILGLPVSEEDETRLLKLGSKLQGLYEEKFRHR